MATDCFSGVSHSGNCVYEPSGCAKPPKVDSSLEAMVEEYLRNASNEGLDRLYKNQEKELWFTNFICGRANRHRDPADGKFCKDSHQYLLSAETIVRAREVLENAGLDRLDNFRDILGRVIDLTRKSADNQGVRGFGVLACYNFALRYSWSRGMCPDVVYLHAGTAEGLGYLMRSDDGNGIKVYNDKKFGCYLDPATLPAPLCELETHHIENFLCVYHENLKRYAEKHPAK